MRILSAITVSMVPESRNGPFVFHGPLEDGISTAAALGFDGVEIFPTHADDIDGYLLRDWLRSAPIRLAAMGTGAGWLTRRLRLTDPDPMVRAAARDFIGAVIDLAGGFGAPAIIGSMQGRHGDGVTREQALDWLRSELNQLGPRAHAHGVPLLYEPLNRYETNLFNTLADAVGFLETLETRNVKLLADLFHMNIEESDPTGAIRSVGRHVGHVHFADSNRRAIGYGHTDVRPIAQTLMEVGYEGFVSGEIFPWPDPETAARKTLESFRANFAG
ncbi:MAG: sugar phosphate isomerase/epimerase [Verrucomicrobia bacterium]|nr:sugar phosphate isomerase/epimerase [Verrucomicrobiota bacterium]